MLGLLGKKKGMSQVFDADGNVVPVTVVEAGPCVIVQKKTKERDGYEALQLGFGRKKEARVSKPLRGHAAKHGTPTFYHLKEFRTADGASLAEGETLTVAAFRPGDQVHVRGVSKGRGFQGVIKRHGKHGGPAAHGSDFHRRPGSIGMRTWPARVLKNTRLPGHMGDRTVMTRNLLVVAIHPEENAILIRGAIPGTREGLLEIISASADFGERVKAPQAAPAEETQDTKE